MNLRIISLLYKKSDYPTKYFTFIGNVKIPEKETERSFFNDYYWEKNGMEEWLIEFHMLWENIDYCDVISALDNKCPDQAVTLL